MSWTASPTSLNLNLPQNIDDNSLILLSYFEDSFGLRFSSFEV